MSHVQQLLVHAHCYQPPREDPWLELVAREPSAAPDHDWNIRITRECYAPLGAAPVLDTLGRIRRVINAWEWLSFDVGPTLVSWLERNAPAVLEAMIAGDRAAIRRTGHGTALAAPYHHVILPLASRRDKETEVRWGIADFERVFGRRPRGMWLPETAVDDETLELLAENGIEFTIVAPHQVESNTGPLRWQGGGREILVIPYSGDLSHGIAFGDLLRDADKLHQEIKGIGSRDPDALAVIAVDGETFGHHHRFGDLGIAALLDRAQDDASLEIVTAEQVASDVHRFSSGMIRPDTSWSCAHGIERWRSDCGCRMDPSTNQQWRAPLREGLERLSVELRTIIEREWPHDAVPLGSALESSTVPVRRRSDLPIEARRLIELERHRLAMFTSCGWFFDDLARIEPRIVMRHAARALDLVDDADRERLERDLVSILARAVANDPDDGNGATEWEDFVIPYRLGVARLAAGFLALREFEREQPIELELPTHEWHFEDTDLVIVDRRTGDTTRWRGEVITMGVVASRVHISRAGTRGSIVVEAIDFPEPVRERLATVAAAYVLDVTLHGDARRALDAGELAPVDARRRALQGALSMVREAGLDGDGDLLLHGVLDLYALAGDWLTLEERASVWRELATMPDSPRRSRLAERLELKLPGES
jgi:hypothetical protein